MMHAIKAVPLLLLVLIGGCNKGDTAISPGQPARGRFAGIGVYDAGRMWAHMAATAPADSAAARLDDDEHVIVVVDSVSGEVRQCGDHSGYCAAMNPWRGGSGAVAALPAKLDHHAADLRAEDERTGKAHTAE